ncbi:antibiotic biosynthesis monooxygenase family protein [Streptomyces nanshensis]|uniref:Antibiotic biosynthesis monooxygenase n=1 Tax=Streptomyces nanshensis TaxID=518642 RepID=A0A1E7LBY0_9ACTN|nr:antibiotic biosynthesis monooxygenase [Streptomyces nanshensis]OEV13696.1 antibiotic biosynthesis monooxygenase [Streptomyces nanshensis]
MSGRVRVLVYAASADGPQGEEAVRQAYHRTSKDLAGVPGLLGNELLRSAHEPDRYVVMSEWQDLAAFQRWEEGAEHRDTTAPLRPFQDHEQRRVFGVYEVEAAYGTEESR